MRPKRDAQLAAGNRGCVVPDLSSRACPRLLLNQIGEHLTDGGVVKCRRLAAVDADL